MYRVDEQAASGPAVETYASELRERFNQVLREVQNELERKSGYPKGGSGSLISRDAEATKSTLTEKSERARKETTPRSSAEQRGVAPDEVSGSKKFRRERSMEPSTVEPAVAALAEETEVQEDYREEEGVDVLKLYKARAIHKVRQRQDPMARLRTEIGLAWGYLKGLLRDELPDTLEDRDDVAYNLVIPVLNEELGVGSWETHKVQRNGRSVTYVRAKLQ